MTKNDFDFYYLALRGVIFLFKRHTKIASINFAQKLKAERKKFF